MAWIFLGTGIIMLGLGASWLVDGASRLALRLGISPMIVGLTVVGFGTSMPEFLVSVFAAFRGSGGMSLGNAVGSNVMNLLLVLGVSAMIRPIVIIGRKEETRRNLIFGLLPAVLLIIGAWGGWISRPLAAGLLLIFALFLGSCFREARSERGPKQEIRGSAIAQAALTIIGMATLSLGADFLVRGGSMLARQAGVSEAVIGLTLVAFGTSLPELAASVMAAAKGEAELSVGNVLGSNVFNLGLVVGSAFSIRPGAVPTVIARFDLPFLVVTTLLMGLVILRDGRIGRKRAFLMLLLMGAFLLFIGLR